MKTFNEWMNEENKNFAIRYVHNDGKGLMNNSSLDYDKLNDDEYFDAEEEYLGLEQPSREIQGKNILFAFSQEGEKQHEKLINLLTKASKNGVKRKLLSLDDYEVVWTSRDGQMGLYPRHNKSGKLY